MKLYPLILDVLRRLQPVIESIRQHDRYLADQLARASKSIALNYSEGVYSRRGNRAARLHNAMSSAKETVSCLEIAEVTGLVERDEKMLDDLDRIVATLFVWLRRPKRKSD